MADPTVTPLFNVPVNPNLNPAAPTALAPSGAVQPTVTNAVQAAPVPQAAAPGGLTEEDQAWKARHSGVAGVARSILGNLGDFLLTHIGLNAQYNPSQKQHKLNYAFDSAPDPLTAINNVQAVDFNLGSKLKDQYIDNQRQAAQQASTAEARATRLGLAQEAVNDRTRGRVGAMLNTMTQWDDGKKAANYPALRNQVLRYGQANGVDLSNELPSTYDSTALDAFINQSLPVGTQRAQQLTADKNAASADYKDRSLKERTDYHDKSIGVAQDRNSITRSHNDVTEDQGNDRIAETIKHNRATEQGAEARANQRDLTTRRGQDLRPQKFVPDASKIYVQNGQRFRYNPSTKSYDPVK